MMSSRSSRLPVRLAVIGIGLALGTALHSTTIVAQSGPSPSYYMYDSRANNGYPPKYPGESNNPQAVVVEGTGLHLGGGCLNSSTAFTVSSVEQQAVAWINSYTPTIIEVTPQEYCASLSAYESAIDTITAYVKSHAASLLPGLWGGFMLDEEPGYGFSVSQLESLNTHVAGQMSGVPGMAWFFTEDQPTGWSSNTATNLADYDGILGVSFPAPQVYNSNFLAVVNNECSTNSVCRNLATIGNWSGFGS